MIFSARNSPNNSILKLIAAHALVLEGSQRQFFPRLYQNYRCYCARVGVLAMSYDAWLRVHEENARWNSRHEEELKQKTRAAAARASKSRSGWGPIAGFSE